MSFEFDINEKYKSFDHSFYLDGFIQDETIGQDMMEANGRYNFYVNTPVYIDPHHVIVGRLDKGLRSEVVINTMSIHGMQTNVLERINASSDYTSEQKDRVNQNFEKMKKYSHMHNIDNYATEEELLVDRSGAALCQHFNGHMVMDYDFILTYGFDGLVKKLKENDNGSNFYKALFVTVSGMQIFIKKHSELASYLIESKVAGYDTDKLTAIIDTCKHIADHPPRNFYEGVQLQWFIMQFSDYDSFGRYDQYLYSLLKKDLSEGTITRDTAKEYVKDMLRRVDDNGDIINMTIGGVTPDGDNAVNDLTYIMLECTRELGLKGPNLCLRITEKSDPHLWEEVAINLAAGQALPALYNDKVFINMMLKHGIPEHDANNYCLAGCSQAVIPGKSNYSCDMGLYTPLKMLELALFDGYDYRTQKQVGLHTGDASLFTSYDEVFEAYNKQMQYCVKLGINLNNQDNIARKDFLSCVRTLLTTPCIERGKGIFNGGAQYYGVQGETIGLTNTANALVAIKELVFEQGLLSMEQLLKALRANFVGYDDVRAVLLNKGKKFGNDIPEVDNIRAGISRDIYNEISSYSDTNDGVHWPGEVIFSYYYDQGLCCMASADGRVDSSVLADSSGPSQGTDLNGPTAILNSALKLPHDLLYTSINLNMKFAKNFWQENHSKVMILFKEYFRQGGSQLQINVLSRQDLISAMERPDEYKGLVVRVGGYSAYFTQLTKAMQIEIASRTENYGE